MQLKVQKIGKHYNQQWLFRNISFKLNEGEKMAVLGKNGSGKSTLLQIIYGLVQPAEGEILMDGEHIDNAHHYFNFTSPLMALPMEFNIKEIHEHQMQIGKMKMALNEFITYAGYTNPQVGQAIQYFSSGMLQRLKTALCLFGTGKIKLLDEPLSNMDKDGEKWYLNCMELMKPENIIIVASNDEAEYQSIENHLFL